MDENQLTPIPTPIPEPRRRGPLILLIAVLVAATAVGAYLWLRGGANASQKLVRTLPKGLPWAFGVYPKAFFEHPPLAKLLAKPEAQGALAGVKAGYGVDILGAEAAALGFQIADNTVQLIGVVRAPLDVDKARAALAMLPGTEARDVKGKPMRSLALGQSFDHYLPDMLLGPAENPPPLPVLPDLVFGVLDDHELVIGTQALVERYLAGGERVGDDSELDSRIGRIESNAFVWGVARLTGGSAEGQFFRDLSKYTPRPADAPPPPEWPDLVCRFDLHFEDKEIVGVGLYDFGSEDDAKRSKAQLEKGFASTKAMLGPLNMTVDLSQSGSSVTITIRFKVPFPE